jgi:hypothetical protein
MLRGGVGVKVLPRIVLCAVLFGWLSLHCNGVSNHNNMRISRAFSYAPSRSETPQGRPKTIALCFFTAPMNAGFFLTARDGQLEGKGLSARRLPQLSRFIIPSVTESLPGKVEINILP